MFESDDRDSSFVSISVAKATNVARDMHWPTLLSGLAIGLVVMQLLVGRSVTRRMDDLTMQVTQSRQQLALLAGSSEDVSVTNDLLSRLTAQKTQLRAANDTMVELQRLRVQVERDSSRLDKALATLEQLHKLQAELVNKAPQMEQAVRTVEASVSLQAKVAEMAKNLPMQSAGIAEAQTVLTQLAQLKQQALNEQSNIAAAREQMNSMGVIVKGLMAAGDKMLQARTTASELVSLKDLLTLQSDGIDRSQGAADRLISMQEQLAAIPQIKVDEARNNLIAMVELQQKLTSQTRQVAQSVENLDLLADFQTVLGEEMTKLEGIRRQLADLVMMESTIARAARVLAPLAELSKIRGLRDDDEVRDAARRLLDRRMGHSTAPRMAEAGNPDVIEIVSPEAVFDAPARPAPAPTE